MPADPRAYLDESVSDYVWTKFLQVPSDERVSGAARKMQMVGSTEAVVVREGKPIGILTERDILYDVVAAGSDPNTTKVVDVMSSPLETVEAATRVRDAIARMTELGIRRLGVTQDGKLIGMLTQKSIVAGSLSEHIPLPELVEPARRTCPYCNAAMKDGKELSRHMEKVHLGIESPKGGPSK